MSQQPSVRWAPCRTHGQDAPSPRMGHIAVAVDARHVWGDEIIVVHGGLGA